MVFRSLARAEKRKSLDKSMKDADDSKDDGAAAVEWNLQCTRHAVQRITQMRQPLQKKRESSKHRGQKRRHLAAHGIATKELSSSRLW
jgi:hypothetical protein